MAERKRLLHGSLCGGNVVPAFGRGRVPLRMGPRAQQFEFRFDCGRDIYFIDVEDIQASRFLEVVRARHPSAIVDVRYVPRFDFIGLPRNGVISGMMSVCPNYVQEPFPFHLMVGPAEWPRLRTFCAESLVAKHPMISMGGPILLLVDSERNGRLISKALAEHLWAATRHQWYAVDCL